MKRSIVALIAALVTLGFGVAVMAADAPPAAPAAPAPIDFTIKNFSTGKSFVLSEELKKGPVAFSYFSSTCASCRTEILDINKALKDGTIKNPKVQFYLVCVDFNDGNIASYQKAQALDSYQFLHDEKYITPAKLGFRSTPAFVIVGKDGQVQFKTTGYDPAESLKKITEAYNAAK